MRQKTVKIPIYQGTLTIILDKDLKCVEKKYKTISLDQFGAVTLRNEAKYRHYVLAFTDKDHLSNIVHEVTHLKNHIFCDCAMELSYRYDEPEAYLMGYLFDVVYRFLHSE